jgi:hypothetical protein
MLKMRILSAVILFISAFSMSTAAISADITAAPAAEGDDQPFILIEGEIIAGD